jgi:hypothetical protein
VFAAGREHQQGLGFQMHGFGQQQAVRSFSPRGVPPGSRVATTVCPNCRKRSTIQACWVLFPAPSMPSKLMKRPRAMVG